MSTSSIPKRSIIVHGHRTSVSIENEFWEHLRRFAHDSDRSINDLVTIIDKARDGHNLSSAIRLWVLAQLEAKLAPQEGR